jgi:hypothetical protein
MRGDAVAQAAQEADPLFRLEIAAGHHVDCDVVQQIVCLGRIKPGGIPQEFGQPAQPLVVFII